MVFWKKRQFLDKLSTYPQRFTVKNSETGEETWIVDIIYKHGAVEDVGTYLNRGHFQPIEEFLSDYSITTSDEIFLRLKKQIEQLGQGILDAQNRFKLYAPINGAAFKNPAAETNPWAIDSSTKAATTASVRALVSQYPFPPKNVQGMQAIAEDNQIEIRWGDPADFIFDQMLLAKWKGTKIVYRTDRYPNNETDGTVLVDNTSKNWYKTTGFLMTGLIAGTNYFFQAFPYCEDGRMNKSIENRRTATARGMVKLPDLSHAKWGMAAVTDANGNVLFAGGAGDGFVYSEIEGYTQAGTKLSFGSMSIYRRSLAAALNGNGNIILAGGMRNETEAFSNVDSITPDGVRISLASLDFEAGWLSGCSDGNGSVLIAGGRKGNEYLSNVYRYDKQGNKTNLSPLSHHKYAFACAKDGAGNVLFGGGSFGSVFRTSVDRYSKEGVKTILSNLSTARSGLATATDGNGNVLFAGGSTVYEFMGSSNIVEKYTKDGVRSTLTPLSVPRCLLAGVSDKDGNVFFGGGFSNGFGETQVDKYTKEGVRTTVSGISTARGYLAAAADSSGKIVWAGGAPSIPLGSNAYAAADKYL